MPALARFYPPVWQGKRNTSCRAPFPGLPGSSQPCSRRIFQTAALRLFYQGTRLRYTTPARVLRNSWRFWCGNWPGRRRPAWAVRRGHAPRREAGGGRRGRRLVFFGRWLLSPGQPRALLGNQRGGTRARRAGWGKGQMRMPRRSRRGRGEQRGRSRWRLSGRRAAAVAAGRRRRRSGARRHAPRGGGPFRSGRGPIPASGRSS